MKKPCAILLLVLLCAALSFAADPVYCKWCGVVDMSGNAGRLVKNYCRTSPTRKHEPYEGPQRRFYMCKYCALELPSFEQLARSPCKKSPQGYHQAYEGADKALYTCKNCQIELTSLRVLITSPCKKTPWGYHDPQ
ncbi:MAG: hypothetical protein LBK61_11405 [Spirochaetaceae bacterium]|jgi:hypothetical protein|nr:hypothetical protein [Spirochaetaceae bacterium]